MAATSRRARSVVLLLALAVASRAGGAGDLCTDGPLQDGWGCYWTAHFEGCADLNRTDTCAWSCGICDRYFPMPECEPDEIAANKERLCRFLLGTKLVPECVVNSTRTWQDFQLFDPSSVGNAHLSTQPRDADPCYSAHAADIGLHIKCDRCGEVRAINFWPDEYGSPDLLPKRPPDGQFLDEFFTFKKLSVLHWQSPRRLIPSFTLPHNHTLLELPVLKHWFTLGIKTSIHQLSSSSLTMLHVGDIWEGRLDDVQFSGENLTHLTIGCYASDSNIDYEWATQSSLGHNEYYDGSTPVVGNIPESICSSRMTRLIIKAWEVSGPIPACLTDSIEVEILSFRANLSGTLAPLFNSPQLRAIRVAGGDCRGFSLPSFLSNMTQLFFMSIPGCGLVGDIPDINSRVLNHLDLSDNMLQGAGRLSGNKLFAKLSGNLIAEWPASWINLTGVSELDMADNPLAEWPLAGVLPLSESHETGHRIVRDSVWQNLAPRFHWPDMQSLILNNCPLNMSVRDFLYSLTYTSITSIEARNCSLHGGIDRDGEYFVPVRQYPNLYEYGFRSLASLSLSNNKVEYFNGEPWSSLHSIDLDHNLLEFLHQGWFSGGVMFLKLQGNPGFRAEVSPPPADGKCPEGKKGGLVADPTAFNTEALHRSDMECTSLCTSQYFPLVDGTANESLCRPVCQIGWYREEKTSPSCTQCSQWPAQTTAHTGSISISSCICSGEYAGLRAIGSQCGCDDGFFLNRVTKTCEKCSYAEMCAWGVDIGNSLLPPQARAGYWIDPASQSEQFSGNDLWLCKSKITCEMDGKCAPGRGGVACSLCLPGTFGGTDGGCRDCPGSQEHQWLFGILAIIGAAPFVIALHGVLVSKSASRSILITLRALRRSFRQLVRQIQAVAIVSGYSVSWPPLARAFFDEMARFSLAVPSWAGAACFGSEQSATVEMVFRWSMPIALALSTLLAVPLSKGIVLLSQRFVPQLLLRVHSAPGQLQMTLWDGTRVFVFFCVMFYATLLEYAFMMFMCPTSPNGNNTVADFPHLKCSLREPEYLVLAVASAVFIVFTLGGLLGSILYAFFGHVREWAQSSFTDHGWWGFLFEDFRSTRSYWLLILMGRDMCLVMVRMVTAGNGLAQLFTATVLSCIIGVSVMADSPYVDHSNTIMECWNHAALALICVYTAGVGYESTPGLGDASQLYRGGEEDGMYRARAIGMFVAQLVAFLVPCMIMLYQLMLIIPHIRRRLPRAIRPHTDEENKAWLRYYFDSFSTSRECQGAAFVVSHLEKFDNVESDQFRRIISSSMASVDIDGSGESGALSPKAYVKRKAAAFRASDPPRSSGSGDVKPQVIGCSGEAGSSRQPEPSDQRALITVQDGGEAAKPDDYISI